MVAGAAQAGAWEEFERRCLVPMENVQTPVTEGLVTLPSKGDDEVWVSSEGWKVSYRSSGERDACEMSGLKWSDEESETLLDWVRTAVPSKRYKAFAPAYPGAPMLFQSTDWREPRIEIAFHRTEIDGDVKLIVEETDLES